MSKPTHHDIAAALGVQPGQVKQLMKRGMHYRSTRTASKEHTAWIRR